MNDKQARFAQEYIIDLNATQAAIRAGYSEGTAYSQGQRLLKHAEVAAFIQEAMDKRSQRTQITADYVLHGIQELVERCIQATPVLDKEGEETGEYRFDSQAALRGYELLGKHLKLFTDKVEHTGKLSLEQILDDADSSSE